jgi:hypothetical protein
VRQINSTLGHHLHEISKTKLEPQIPAHAEDDDFPVKMAALEKFINAQHAGSGPLMARSPANMPRFRYLYQSHAPQQQNVFPTEG